jgi:hypothetical protein
MKKIFLILCMSIIMLGTVSCESPMYRTPTSANISMTEAGARVSEGAKTVLQSAEITQKLAESGYKQSKEPISKERFSNIALLQKEYIIPQATDLEDQGDFIIDKNKGQLKVKFTFKVLGVIFGILSIMAVLSYFGLGGLVRNLIKMAVSPIEAAVSDIADTVAKQAYHSEIPNSVFPRGIRERMLNKEEVPEKTTTTTTPIATTPTIVISPTTPTTITTTSTDKG